MTETVDTPTQSLALRKTLVPSALAELGVRIGQEPDTGMQVIVIPPEVRQACNVLMPVSSFAQADPNWTPSVHVVALNPDPQNGPHFYSNASWRGRIAPTKQALELLAKAAGVLYTRTARVPRGELADGEAFAYRATIGIRRSDGTVEELVREKGYESEVEHQEIVDAVLRSDKYQTAEARNAEVRKRWLQEQKFAKAKTESKAVLRAIRAALQIPHQFTPADAAKPFVVVGFSFTPDYDDVEVKRALVAAGLNAHVQMYGDRGAVSGELEAGVTDPEPPAAGAVEAPDAAAAEAGSSVTGPAADGDQQAEGAAETPAASSAPGPVFTGEEPPPPDKAPQAAPKKPTLKAAADTVIPDGMGRYAGRTIQQVHKDENDPAYLSFLVFFPWDYHDPDAAEAIRLAARVYCEKQLPTLLKTDS